MINQPITVSALLTTHLSDEHLLRLLDSLLNTSIDGLEIIIINDSASDSISRRIHEKVQACDNDLVFLFEHEQPTGRGNCLNEALREASGKFIWAPERADRFNEQLFKEAFRRFKADPAAIWVLDYNLPDGSKEWVDDALEGRLPDDSCFIWNRQVLNRRSFFFNPFLTHLHGAELALRTYGENVWHRTDPFFVIGQHQFLSPVGKNLEEFIRSVHRMEESSELKSEILQSLKLAEEESLPSGNRGDLLAQCRQLLAQDDAKNTLSLIDAFLKKEPDHYEATQIKISALEKLRRHVEAAELKHDLRKLGPATGPVESQSTVNPQEPESGSEPESASEPDLDNEIHPMGELSGVEEPASEVNIKYSVVVPTTGMGKNQLERCLSSLAGAASRTSTELIVIDNASIDDTFDYLEQLTEKEFLNIRVITNSSNAGFGASVNQGIDAAEGDFVLILHNDVEVQPNLISELAGAFEADPDIAITAPLLDESKLAGQNADAAQDEDESVILTDSVDSCCFMIRSSNPLRMERSYGLAYFEMDDFCMRIREEGGQIAVSTKTKATHHSGATTRLMGFRQTPQRKWRNRALLHDAWGGRPEYQIPEQGTIADRIEQLAPPVDPANPPDEWRHTVTEFLTDEIRTEILRSNLSKRELMVIVPTLLMADCRDLLRTLEDRLDDLELPPSMLLLFVNYYFEKNIYSRCRHYLEMAGDSHPAFDLFRLKIHVADKELDDASALLATLLEKYPASPDLFALAARLYEHAGDKDEANSFAAMANQLDPISYPPEESAFEVKF